MSLLKVHCGTSAPQEFNVIIEIPMNGEAVKYEVDKDTGAIFVDRLMNTAMHYPVNYGYIPQTLAGDGDPVDVLVITPMPLMIGSVIPCRAIGLLKMEDEAGVDAKVLAVPTSKLTKLYDAWKEPADVSPVLLGAITHFFEHYKDLDAGKWVKVTGWEGLKAAQEEVMNGIANAQGQSRL
ncbi:MAG: inorganic diphosphatase [Ottowia sp.]|nr:inorganic diphosphatase [Ottowia sp.]